MSSIFPKNKPSAPKCKLSGNKIVSKIPYTCTLLTDEIQPYWITKIGNHYTQQKMIEFSSETTVTLFDPDGKSLPNYNTNADFIGSKAITGKEIGKQIEIYYTLNGKDPKIEQSYLYSSPLIFDNNVSGSDNISIRTRSCQNGQWSEMNRLELNIALNIDATNIDIDIDDS